MATPEKKTTAPKARKANTGKDEAAVQAQDAIASSSKATGNAVDIKASEATEGRKRAKTTKEVVAAKKPKRKTVLFRRLLVSANQMNCFPN